jgi:DNA-directed RNA polymerase subunit M/transcription elongation factor TFIIS
MKLMVICESCGDKFSVDKTKLRREQFKQNVNDKRALILTSYICESCGRIHYVQIDNDETLSLLQNVQKSMGILVAQKRTGIKSHKNQTIVFNQTRSDLDDARKKLTDSYNDRILINAKTNEQVLVVFSK